MADASLLIKRTPEDWRVMEIASLLIDDEGPQRYFYVEKCGLNTLDVVCALGHAFGLATQEIGYAGRKDKWAVTKQWFSAPTRLDWPDIPGTRCLETKRGRRKIRVGELIANAFELTLRDVKKLGRDDFLTLCEGFNNGFGLQRVSADNVARASRWLEDRRRRRPSRAQRGWYLSVLRSLLFNAVIEHRDSCIGLPRIVEGDVLVEGLPSGPMWGRGRSLATGQARQIECEALTPYQKLCDGLEYAGVKHDRRVMFARPANLQVTEISSEIFILAFTLPKGVYATTMLSGLGEIRVGHNG